MNRLITKLIQYGRKRSKKMFVVGGFLRDLLLGGFSTDFDIVIVGKCASFARNLASHMGGSFVILDEENRIYRVVIKKENSTYNLDFSQMRGKDIIQDLGRRDFTIDAMALELNRWTRKNLSPNRIIDPYKGLRDLEKKRIRMVSKTIFLDDPLRMLRAYRLAGDLNFNIDPQTEKQIRINAKMIKKTSVERIALELFKILRLTRSLPLIKRLEEAGILGEIMPEVNFMKRSRKHYFHRGGLWEHSIESLKAYEEICERLEKFFPRVHTFVQKHLAQEVSSGIDRRTILKLAVLFHDLGKPKTRRIKNGRVRFFGHTEIGANITRSLAERLKFSRNIIDILTRVVAQHMRPSNLDDQKEVSDRAVYRFFRDLKGEAIDILIVSLADRYSYLNVSKYKIEIKRHKRFVNWMMKKYFLKKDEVLPKPLLRGNEIMELLGIPQGPLVGRLINKLLEAQATGKVKNKKEAKLYLRKVLKKK